MPVQNHSQAIWATHFVVNDVWRQCRQMQVITLENRWQTNEKNKVTRDRRFGLRAKCRVNPAIGRRSCFRINLCIKKGEMRVSGLEHLVGSGSRRPLSLTWPFIPFWAIAPSMNRLVNASDRIGWLLEFPHSRASAWWRHATSSLIRPIATWLQHTKKWLGEYEPRSSQNRLNKM